MSTIISCTSRSAADRSNPLLESWEDLPFGIAPFERIKPDHYLEAFDVAIDEQRANIAYIVSDSVAAGFHETIVALDGASHRLMDLGDLFEMCEMAISDADWVRVSEIVKPKISVAMDSVWMNDELFRRVKSVYDSREELDLNDVDARLLERTYRRFVRGGAELNDELKSRVVEINSRLALLSSRFAANLIADSDSFVLELKSKELEGLSGDIKRLFWDEAQRRGLSDRWVITLNPSSMTSFLTHSARRDLREKIYKAYLKRGSNGGEADNRDIVAEMTSLRGERAKILGYENHAEYVISEQMAGSAEAAYELLDAVWTPALAKAEAERDELQKLLKKDDSAAALEAWDWWYYAEKYSVKEVGVNDDVLRQYFPVDGVRAGAFTLANRLYGITFRPVAVPLYDPSCVAYEVLDRDGSHLGVLYFDLYARANKSYGAWCGNLREQRTDGGDRVTPVVAITCNFPQPSTSTPTLLNLEQVETLFHEFGHALHFIFQNVDYRSMSAESVEGDFVEFPSQVMENWALEPEVLRLYALHYRSAKPMEEDMMAKIVKQRRLNQGFETITYLSAALLDLELQQLTSLDDFSVENFEQRVLREERSLISQIEPKYHLPYFAHPFIYDYSAGYYFYLWSEVLDKDCFELFRKSGEIFSRELADRLRREVLRRGSEASGADLYRAFKGVDPSRVPMLVAKGLMDESEIIEENEEVIEEEVEQVEEVAEPEVEQVVEPEVEPTVEAADAEVDDAEQERRVERAQRNEMRLKKRREYDKK